MKTANDEIIKWSLKMTQNVNDKIIFTDKIKIGKEEAFSFFISKFSKWWLQVFYAFGIF
jgi:hypothetical protein